MRTTAAILLLALCLAAGGPAPAAAPGKAKVMPCIHVQLMQVDARVPVSTESVVKSFAVFYETLKKYNKDVQFTSDAEVKMALASLGFKDADAGKAWADFKKWYQESRQRGADPAIPPALSTELKARHAVFFTLEPLFSYLPPKDKELSGEAVVERDQVKLLAFLKRLDTNTVLSSARFSQAMATSRLESYCNDAALKLSGLSDLIAKNETPAKVEKIDVSAKKPLKADGASTTFVFFSEAVTAEGAPLREVLTRGYSLAVRCRFGSLKAASAEPMTPPGSFKILQVKVTKTLDYSNLTYRAPQSSEAVRKACRDTLEIFAVSSLDGTTVLDPIGSVDILLEP